MAHITTVGNSYGGFLYSDHKVDDRIAESYRKVAGKEMNATPLNHGEYNGSLSAELDKEIEFRQLLDSSKLTGKALFELAFETGKPVKAYSLQGDKGFDAMVPVLQKHSFPAVLPGDSKARLLREVRVVCSPYAGCDAYILLPTAFQIPARTIVTEGAPGSAGTKTVEIEVQH